MPPPLTHVFPWKVYLDGSLAAGYGREEARAELAIRSPQAWALTYLKAAATSAV